MIIMLMYRYGIVSDFDSIRDIYFDMVNTVRGCLIFSFSLMMDLTSKTNMCCVPLFEFVGVIFAKLTY